MPLLASTYAYTFGLNAVKRAWAFQPEDGSQHLDIVARCCAIKVSRYFFEDFQISTAAVCLQFTYLQPMTAWHLNKVATTCRERCGGQGYLSVNRFGEIFASAHAGMTAEGKLIFIKRKYDYVLDSKYFCHFRR